nr:hypothetical protein [uncultured Sediminibacterium sp.]
MIRTVFIKSYLVSILLSIGCPFKAIGQQEKVEMEAVNWTTRMPEIPYEKYLPEGKDIILISELHNVSSTYPVLESVLQKFILKGFRNIIQEMPFSYSIICNEYLETGDTAYLNMISSSEEAKKFYTNIRALFLKLNKKESPRFWGIDFELGESRMNYVKAAAAILRRKYHYPPYIQRILGEINNSENILQIKSLRNELSNTIEQGVFQNQFNQNGIDLLTVFASRNDTYTKHRDIQLFQNLFRIDSIIKAKEPDAKYIGSFGLSHVNTALKYSLSSILLSDTAWSNRTSIIGTHYFNCISNYGLRKETIVNDIGVLPKSISKSLEKQIVNTQDKSLIVVKPERDISVKRKLHYALVLVLISYPGERKNLQRIME